MFITLAAGGMWIRDGLERNSRHEMMVVGLE